MSVNYGTPERGEASRCCNAYKLALDRLQFVEETFEEHSDQNGWTFHSAIRKWMIADIERAEAEMIEAVRVLDLRRDVEIGKRQDNSPMPMQPYGTGSTMDELWPGQMRGVPDPREEKDRI